MKTYRLYTLFQRYLEQSASPEEGNRFFKALIDPSNADLLKKWIGDCWEKEYLYENLYPRPSQELYKSIRKAIKTKKIILFFSSPYHVAVAVLIIAALFSGDYFIQVEYQRGSHKTLVQVKVLKASDFSPARIRLTNRDLLLENLKQGSLTLHKNFVLLDLAKGQNQSNGTTVKRTYITLSNPRGSKTISITLSDDSKVQL
jgi:hypothetical protein